MRVIEGFPHLRASGMVTFIKLSPPVHGSVATKILSFQAPLTQLSLQSIQIFQAIATARCQMRTQNVSLGFTFALIGEGRERILSSGSLLVSKTFS